MKPNKDHGYTSEELNRMCLGKHRWSDELSARAAAITSLELRPKTLRLFTYKCPSCRGYHLTRSKQPGQEPVMLPGETMERA